MLTTLIKSVGHRRHDHHEQQEGECPEQAPPPSQLYNLI